MFKIGAVVSEMEGYKIAPLTPPVGRVIDIPQWSAGKVTTILLQLAANLINMCYSSCLCLWLLFHIRGA